MVSADLGYAAVLVALGLERIAELLVSSSNANRAFALGGYEVGRGHYRWMVAFHSLFWVCCGVEGFQRAFHSPLGWVFFAGALLGQGLRYWAIATLKEQWNVRVIVVPGRAVVTKGPYRFLRHPNYVAVAIELFCVPMIRGAWITALVFTVGNAFILWFRIRAEESALGEDYARAFARRPRFIPSLRRHA